MPYVSTRNILTGLALMLSLLATQGCNTIPGRSGSFNPVVGAWWVHDVAAPRYPSTSS
jgi:hypothetical protein